MSTLSPDLGRCISSFLNCALQNKLNIEKSLQINTLNDGQTVGGTAAQQTSPGSVLSNDECYDPNVDDNFTSILAPAHSTIRQLLPDQSDNLSDSIYERLPDDEQQQHQRKLSNKVNSVKNNSAFNHISSLNKQRSRQKTVAQFGVDQLIDNDTDDQQHQVDGYFAPIYVNHSSAGGEEQLVKPSQIKQRRRLQNCK